MKITNSLIRLKLNNSKNILIVNQHGENRGDEAAMRAMLDGISQYYPNSHFTLVCQFMQRDLTIDFKEDTTILPMLIPAIELPGLFIYIIFKSIGISLPFILGANAKRIIKAYKECDLVMSAPGGPYFGDIYSGALGYHELAHWLMIYMAKLHKKKAFLYSPSAGPFKKKWLNPIRKSLYNYFSELAIREEISQGYLKALLPHRKIHLTADSALQRKVTPTTRKKYFGDRYEKLKDKFLVSVSVNDYKYPLSNDVAKNKADYLDCMIKLINHIATIQDAHFIMYPQLHGGVHSDYEFLEKVGSMINSNISWEIVDHDLNSDEQQSIWGMTDFTLASRYHPQIFSAIQGIPYLCIYYEHKQLGFIKALDLEKYAFDIYNVKFEEIKPLLEEAIENRAEIKEIINKNIQPIVEKAKNSTKIACSLLS